MTGVQTCALPILGDFANDELNIEPVIDTPSERARLDFDDFDDEPVQSLTTTAPEPEPTPTPTKAATARTVPVFDFEDDDFD